MSTAKVKALAALGVESGLNIKSAVALPVAVTDDVVSYGGKLWVGRTVDGVPAMLPLGRSVPRYVHHQGTAASMWAVSHGLDCPGTPTIIATDQNGARIEPMLVTAVSRNQTNITFSSLQLGTAVLVFDEVESLGSLRVAELTVGGRSVLTDANHSHTFAQLTGLPTTLAGYGITDAAPLASPSLTGVPTAPTAPPGTSTPQIATTAFVRANKTPVLNVEGGLGWKDIMSELVSRGGASAPSLALFRGSIYAYKFEASSVDQLYASFHIPHDYAPGTPLFLHIHWADVSTTPTGVVRWGFEYVYAKGHGQEAFGNTQTVYTEQAAGGSYVHMIAETATGILADVCEPDGLLLVRVFRDAAHANDTNPAGVFAFSCDVHYQTDRVATLNRSPNFYA